MMTHEEILLSTKTALFMDRDGAGKAEQHAGGGCAVYQQPLTGVYPCCSVGDARYNRVV